MIHAYVLRSFDSRVVNTVCGLRGPGEETTRVPHEVTCPKCQRWLGQQNEWHARQRDVSKRIIEPFINKLIADGVLPNAPFHLTFRPVVHDGQVVDMTYERLFELCGNPEPEPDKPITVRIAE